MRSLLLGFMFFSLVGCATWMPWLPRHDPDQAWIDLQPHGETQLEAVAVDTQPLVDGRYFQVEPGTRRLEMRYRFEVGAENVGNDTPLERSCRLMLEYDDFDAGSRYRLVAGGLGFRPWAKLYDEQNHLLAQAREQGCGA